tara:strand:+ start:125 stop:4183 length:4059 start_codon:yes stop_codon:yes gene_type:complete
MAFNNKEVYEIAKKYVKSQLGNFDLFESVGSDDENNFALACFRLLYGGQKAFIDPTNNKQEFSQIVKQLKLNELEGGDLGFGNETANNLIYRLFITHIDKLSSTDSLTERQKSKTKLTFMNRAFSNEFFIEDLAVDRLNEKDVYEVVTKQAFYNWHYQNFVENKDYNEIVKTRDDLRLSNWSDADPQDGVVFFIDQAGGPFNNGAPTICCVIEDLVGDPKKIFDNKEEYIKKCFDSIFPIFGKKKYSDLEEDDRESADEYILSKLIDHTKNKSDYLPFSFVKSDSDPNSKLFKICVGADYASLVFGLRGNTIVKNYRDMAKVKKFIGKEIEFPTITALNSVDEQETLDIYKQKISKASTILDKKDEMIQRGPALFFDLEKDPEIFSILQDDLEKYELIDKDTSKEILKAQYSPSGKDFSESIKSVYGDLLLKRYVSNRLQFLDLISEPSYRNRVYEDMVFYYKYPGFKLMAVGARKRPSKEDVPEDTQILIQKNNVPFEFSELKDDGTSKELYIPEIENAYSIITRIDFTGKDLGQLSTGIAGEILFTTEFLIEEILQNGSQELKSLINPESKNFKNNLYDVVSFKDFENALPPTNNSFISVLLLTTNSFFNQSNLMILADEKEDGKYSLLERSLDFTTEFFTGNETFKDLDTVILDDIGSFMSRLHYPFLMIKPTAPKQRSSTVEEPDIGLVKPPPTGQIASSKQKKEKIYDLDVYNSWYNNSAQKVFVVLAQASDSACFEDLAKRIDQGSTDEVFEFLLTKFPWDEIVAKKLKNDLKKLSNLTDPESLDALNDQLNACFQDVDTLLANFARLKDLLANFDKIVKANLPQIPTIPEMPYLYVLDFQAFFRKIVQEAINKAIKALIGELVSVMLTEILNDCKIDTSLEKLFDEKLSGADNKSSTGEKEALNDLLGGQPNDLQKTSVDIVNILRASRLENLDNIFNGVYELFPVLNFTIPDNINKARFMEEYLSSLSDSLPAFQTKSLLDRSAGSTEYNKVSQFTIEYGEKSLEALFTNRKNISLLFKYLRQFIDLDLINQQIVRTSVIIPDPCFVNFGKFSEEDLQILKELLGDDVTQEFVKNSSDILSDQIAKICNDIAKLSGGLTDFNNRLKTGFISESSKKALDKVINTSINNIVSYQNKTKSQIKKDAAGLIESLKYLYTGDANPNRYEGIKPIVELVNLKEKPFIYDVAGIIDKTNFDEFLQEEFVDTKESINKKTKPKVEKFYNDVMTNASPVNFNGKTGLPVSLSTQETIKQLEFFKFLAISSVLSAASEQTSILDIIKLLTDLSNVKIVFDETDKVFSDPQLLKVEYKKTFDLVVAEGGKNTNFFISNLKKMKQIINNQKTEND